MIHLICFQIWTKFDIRGVLFKIKIKILPDVQCSACHFTTRLNHRPFFLSVAPNLLLTEVFVVNIILSLTEGIIVPTACLQTAELCSLSK